MTGKRLKKFVVDTNVPKKANLSKDLSNLDDEDLDCVAACVQAIRMVMKQQSLVIDAGDEIYHEYRNNLNLRGQPGLGDEFMKWVHDYRFSFPEEDRVKLTGAGASYAEFPAHKELHNFDNSDRKFVAVANAHPHKPQIFQATDSKWWGWKEALAESGINVLFLCPEFVQKKYDVKIGKKAARKKNK